MKKSLLLLLFCFLFLAACSKDDAEETEQTEDVTDETLTSVVKANVTKLMEKDFDGYMATIHTDSPVYETTKETIDELFNYTLDVDLSDLAVKEKSEDEALVSYTQRTVRVEGPDFQDNETIGEHLLKQDAGEWKIYSSEVIEVNAIDREEEQPKAEAVEMAGSYATNFSALENPFDTEDWALVSYNEGEGEATAEYIHPDENLGNYSEIVTLDYYENGNELSGLANFISVFELNLIEMTTGTLEFERLSETETEVLYQFTLADDSTQENQEEIGRIFVKENDIYTVRYTTIDGAIQDVDVILETLRAVQ
ncbi:hypothetical protein JYK21_01870 [Ralstonia pickettii]|nr:hypothetical protein [Ralstonia pickettii]